MDAMPFPLDTKLKENGTNYSCTTDFMCHVCVCIAYLVVVMVVVVVS